MINVEELNSRTDLFDYNCGGFALGCGEWYCPDQYDEGQESPRDMLADCVDDILADFPELSRVSHYSGIPDNYDVIGFRLCVGEYVSRETGEVIEEVRDLHFILRSEGVWYHKPGSTKVQEINFDVDGEWPHNEYNYNSTIVWFAREHREIALEDMPLVIPSEKQEEEEEAE